MRSPAGNFGSNDIVPFLSIESCPNGSLTVGKCLVAIHERGCMLDPDVGRLLAASACDVWDPSVTGERFALVRDLDLGLVNPYALPGIMGAAESWGFHRCDAVRALAFCAQRADRPRPELMAAMDPVEVPGRESAILWLLSERGGTARLLARAVAPETLFVPGTTWIFLHRTH